MQILVYIWTQEGVIVKAVVAALGIYAVFPLLHFLPIRWKARRVMGGDVSNLRSVEEGTIVPVHPQVTTRPKFTSLPVLYESPGVNVHLGGEFPLASGPSTS